MITLVLSKVPEGIRGHLTKWLLEVAPGVFVGRVSSRIRDHLWDITCENIGEGTAIMVIAARNEQGFTVRNVGHRWKPVDLDGFIALRRPPANDTSGSTVRTVIPKAARYRYMRAMKPK